MTCLLDNVWRSCILTTSESLKVDQESLSLISIGSLAEIKLFTVIHVYTGRWKIYNLNWRRRRLLLEMNLRYITFFVI